MVRLACLVWGLGLECIDSSSYCIMRHILCADEVLEHTEYTAPMDMDLISYSVLVVGHLLHIGC